MSRRMEIPDPLLNGAMEVFRNKDKAERWLTRGHSSLNGLSPAEAARTEEGCSKVKDLFGRIEHGVYD